MGISLSNVSFSYYHPRKKQTPKFVLKNINLNIKPNDEFITIVGHTGSGKTTLVQLFNALLTTNYGELKVFNKTINDNKNTKLNEVRKKVGSVFQFPEYQLFEETVFEDVSFGPKNFGLDEINNNVEKALNLVGISKELYEKSPFNLSGGQMRRVAIAGILASNPDIIILDEPTVGLDPQGKKELLKLLKKLNEEEHKTIILITHDMDVVSEVSKRVILLDQGEIIYDGNKLGLFQNEELIKNHSIDYPSTIKMLKTIKNKLNVNINCFQFTIDEAYNELRRVFDNNER
jgi:energy-coupling factor transport system ATP-binding protein